MPKGMLLQVLKHEEFYDRIYTAFFPLRTIKHNSKLLYYDKTPNGFGEIFTQKTHPHSLSPRRNINKHGNYLKTRHIKHFLVFF